MKPATPAPLSVLLIDNYDSFVFNIARCFTVLGACVTVVRNDALSLAGIAAARPDALVLSPGPCTPDEAGITLAAIAAFSGTIPLLGICLGHQAIGQVFGGRVVRARRPMHGQAAPVTHDGEGLFRTLPSPLSVGRYHSLIVETDAAASAHLRVTARSPEGEIMGLAHRHHPTCGVQFHPESIVTDHGDVVLANFLHLAAEHRRR
ncbi:aminodeoxychorismate/anthranilate synthase component II [Pseudoxanthobacter sp.]|uniref:anthranilate synthase component II n=1 Tax=Pseudoxanthobacter sp. TaxID=1925742 RepID=UPI002FE16C78